MRDDREQHVSAPVPFGRLLRELRLAAGLSQEALAELAQMSAGGISVLERGARRAPQRETLELLAGALNLSPPERERFDAAARSAGNARRRRDQRTTSARKCHNLPLALTSFVGRERETNSLRTHIAEHRLVTLTGVGGVGKTRLALETAHGMLDAFADGVWLVELASIVDGAFVAQRIAETLGVAVQSETTQANSNSWMRELVDRQVLLILDNCEHLLTPCAVLARQLLSLCPRLHILATSREPLRLTGERVVRLQPLAESPAIEMFLDRARNAAPEFSIAAGDDEAWRYVRTIREQLDGIPFAIELAAARVSALSLKMIAENIGRRLSLLRHGDRASISRHKTMRALIDWSYDLLSPIEQRVFEQISIFGGGCTLESATTVCVCDAVEDVLDPLTSLVEKSLVVVDFHMDEPRYGLLETSREYAREKLVASGELERVAQRHVLAYLDLAERLDAWWGVAPDRAWHAQARPELENWRIAINWAFGKRHDVLLGQRLIGALQPVWTTFALTEGRRWCRSALELVDGTTPRDVVARLAYTEAIIAFVGGESITALAAAERALAEYSALVDHRGVVKAETIVGRALIDSGRRSEGESRLLDALETARSIDDRVLTAVVHQGLGLSRGTAGDLEGARGHIAEALAIAKAASAERIALVAGMVSAEAYFSVGDMNEAIKLGTEAADVARALGDELATMRALANLATYLLASDRYDEARDAARESLEFLPLAGGSTMVAWTVQHLAMVAALRQQNDEPRGSDDRARAARLFGFTEAQLTALGAHGDLSDRLERDRLKQILENALGPKELERLTSIGATMSEAQAIETALGI